MSIIGKINRQDTGSVIMLCLAVLAILWRRFGSIILHPDGYLFTNSGDGLKNYFVFGYYLRHDQGLSFSGLNYPYGDHLLFTDSHPFFALFLNWIDDHLFEISHHAVGLINLAIVGGIFLGAILIYLILRHFSLPWWYAILISLCITFLSPQLDRIHGHLSLSYVFAIPLFWWLILKGEGGETKWYLFLVLTGFIMGGIHLYYVGIYSAFLLAYLFARLVIRGARLPSFQKTNWLLFGCAILPLIGFQILAGMTDPFDDRSISPYGFYAYYATPASIFLPHFSSLTYFFNTLFSPKIIWEGRAFIGVVPLLFCLSLLSMAIWRFRNKLVFPKDFNRFSPFLLAAIIVLLYSMCLPFRWGLQFITDLIAPLKQFRALGRFSWVFYYVIGIISSYYLYQLFDWLSDKVNKRYAILLLCLAISAWAMDAGAFYLSHTKNLIHANDKLENNSDKYLRRLTTSGFQVSDFQGIMALPLIAIRTDKMVFEKNYTGYNEAMKCAFHTGLSIIQSSTSRPSLSQSLSNIQLISDPRIAKERMKDMDRRPFLLITAKNVSLEDGEQRLVDKAKVFWEDQHIQLSALPVTAFEVNNSPYVFPNQPIKVNGPVRVYYEPSDDVQYLGYNEASHGPAFRGVGSNFGKKGPLVLYSGVLKIDTIPLEASFWVYIDPTYHGMPVVIYSYGKNDVTKENREIDIRRISDIVDGWLRVEILLEAVNWHKIELYGHDITADEFLIRPQDLDVRIDFGDGQQTINNFPLSNTR